jgi:prenylcysteine oxidase/farnesylcysteine lyase
MSTIAIIGAGAAGTMAAYRVRRALPGAGITVFEREAVAGGRAHRIEFAGTQVEVGATVLHSTGQWIKALMKLAGLKPGQGGVQIDGKSETFGFWNGSEFTLLTKSSMAALATGLVRRYGPSSGARVTGVVRRTAGKWDKIYSLQKAGRLFATTEELLGAVGLADLPKVSLRHALARAGAKGDFIAEILGAITRNMYTQDAGLNAFAGEVGLAGAGLAGGSLFALEEGNQTLFARALDRLEVDLQTETKVTRIECVDPAWRPEALAVGGKRKLLGRKKSGDGEVAVPAPSGRLTVVTKEGAKPEFDAVVLAAPLELADLKVSAARRLVRLPPRLYQEVHVTLVSGEPSRSYFGLAPDDTFPSTVFASSSPRTPFCSLGLAGRGATGERLWKVLTVARPLSNETLHRMFARVTETARFVWKGAYPVLTPGAEAPPFILAPGVYYAGGLESAASTVDVSSVAGYNAAGLALRQLAD